MFVYYLFSKKTADVGLLLTLNEMRAQKELAVSVTRTTFKLEPLVEELRGYGISLKMALIWQIQQSRSHQGSSHQVVLIKVLYLYLYYFTTSGLLHL